MPVLLGLFSAAFTVEPRMSGSGLICILPSGKMHRSIPSQTDPRNSAPHTRFYAARMSLLKNSLVLHLHGTFEESLTWESSSLICECAVAS